MKGEGGLVVVMRIKNHSSIPDDVVLRELQALLKENFPYLEVLGDE